MAFGNGKGIKIPLELIWLESKKIFGIKRAFSMESCFGLVGGAVVGGTIFFYV